MDELAIHGGHKACAPGTIPAWPIFDDSEEQALLRTLRSRLWWRIPGREVDAFEASFARFHDIEHALAVSNGTQAIELALATLGIGFGDEVIVPAFTFASTATAVLHAGATPVTVDVDLDTYCMTPEAFERAITPRTRAVIPVHLAGQVCEMADILAIAARHDIKVIGDAAHAHGARWRGQSVATLGDMAIFSFQSGKLLTAGEGGALVTRDPALIQRAWIKTSCGRPRTDRRYEHVELGTNMRMGEFQGAILGAQLQRFPQQLAEREEAAQRLDALIAELPGLRVQARTPDVTTHSHYMYMLRLDGSYHGVTRDFLVEALVAEGVPAYFSYRAIPDFPMFATGALWAGTPPASLSPAEVRGALERHPIPVSRELAARSLWLHHTVLLGGQAVQVAVAGAIRKVMERAERRTAA